MVNRDLICLTDAAESAAPPWPPVAGVVLALTIAPASDGTHAAKPATPRSMRSSVSGASGRPWRATKSKRRMRIRGRFEIERGSGRTRPVEHGEIGVGKPRVRSRKLGKRRLRLDFETIETAVGEARDVAYRAVVLAHQLLRARAAAESRDFVLTLEAELVVVARRQVVQKTANLEKHGDAGGKIVIARTELRQPAQHLKIAQSAGRVFDVGLKMVDGALELRVALVGELRRCCGRDRGADRESA